MREHEHRRMERRVVAPPPFPVEVFPRSALGSELITPHDFGADVTGEVASAVVVKTVRSPRIGAMDPTRGTSIERQLRPAEQHLSLIHIFEGRT